MAERSLKRRVSDNVRGTDRKFHDDDAARKQLWECGMYPMSNPFHYVPMGYK